MPARKFDVSQFKVISFLGEGAFGQVCLVEDKQNKSEDNKFALKVLEKKLIKANYSEEYVRREIEIQSHLIHRTIVRCFGYFHDEVNVYIVLEHLERSIYDELQRQPYNRFTEKRSARIMWYVADALSFLHERDVLHRDIKPANLLLHRDGTVKLGDFGLAVILRGEKRRTICGSVPYLAPESNYLYLLFTFFSNRKLIEIIKKRKKSNAAVSALTK